MLCELVYKLQVAFGGVVPQRRLELPPSPGRPRRGRALVSYKPLPLIGDPALFRGHSSVWESSAIVAILNRLGFSVDLIDWRDDRFSPKAGYDVVFDIHRNLLRFGETGGKRIFHVTGSHPEFSNAAELRRLDDLRERRGVQLLQRRGVTDADLRIFSENLEAADLITLIGNEVTAATFPRSLHPRIERVVATGSFLPRTDDPPQPEERKEFLWFNGAGAVHKGLDLVLEVFARNPGLTLHVVGPYAKERDFVEAYRHELSRCPNIHAHGFLYPDGSRFRRIASRVLAFINPTCSEGISTASITCMQYGLIPILSREAGITLPDGLGKTLEHCSLDEIEACLRETASLGSHRILGEMKAVRAFARETYSRPAFSACMERALGAALAGDGGVTG